MGNIFTIWLGLIIIVVTDIKLEIATIPLQLSTIYTWILAAKIGELCDAKAPSHQNPVADV